MTTLFPYEPAVHANEVDMNPQGIEKVAGKFLLQQKQGIFPGGQIVARRHGKVVLKVSCGLARGWQGRGGETQVTVQENTPFPVFSTGKPMAAVVIAMLESRGVLDVMATVASVLPEFGSLGREHITIEDVLTHRAGILLPALIENHGIWADREAVWQYLLKTPPRYPRGTFAYMPAEYGVILDRIITKLTNKTLAELFIEELARPLGLQNMHYGLDSHHPNDIAWSYWQGKDRYVVAEMNVADRFEELNNDLLVFTAENPAFSMVSDACSLAAFYEFLVNGGRTNEGQQLVSEDIIKRYTTRQVSGWNKSMKTYLSLGRGFMLGTLTPSLYDWWGSASCYGHAGMFSSTAFADHDTGLAVSIVTNGNRGIGDFFKRMVPLTHALRKACK